MFDALFPQQYDNSLAQSLQRPKPQPQPPGAFTGFGSALADAVPYAVTSSAGAWAQVLDAYGKAAAFRDAPAAAMLAGRPAPDMATVKNETIDQIGDSTDVQRWRRAAKSYEPDPNAVGVAGQIVHGVASSLVKAGAYTVAGGPLAPALFGADVGINRAQELTEQGVDGGTAALAGVASGVAGAVGLKLPAALGATRLQSAAIGAALNPALNVAEVGGIRMLLNHADYPQIAARYQPFDPTSLAVASITGAAFGAAFHGAKAHTPAAKGDIPTLTPDEHAAALVMNEVQTHNADTLADPRDLQAVNAAHDAQTLARVQMDAGEPVHVMEMVEADPKQVEAARATVFERMTDDLRAELLADAGNRAEPGEIPAARAQLAALQNDIERIQADDVFRTEAKVQQQQRGLSRKQAEAAARDAIGQRQADLQAQAERLSNIIEANRRAAQAEQDLATLNRGQIPERFADRFDVGVQRAQGEPAGVPVDQPIPGSQAARAPDTLAQQGMAPAPQSDAMAVLGQLAGDTPATLMQRVVDVVQTLTGRGQESPPAASAPKADTPEQSRAFEIAERDPDTMLPTGETDADNNPIYKRAADVVREAHEIEQQARAEDAAFRAAVNCALRFPQ